jgi:hypothetical protein
MVVVLFGVLRSVLAMVGVIARVVIKVKINITNGLNLVLAGLRLGLKNRQVGEK